MTRTNSFGQPIGVPLPDGWEVPSAPSFQHLDGSFVRLERLDAEKHAEGLFSPQDMGAANSSWTYLPYGPFDTLAEYKLWVAGACGLRDVQFYAILSKDTGVPLGVCSYLRINPSAASIEVGHIWMSSRLQRTAMATEAMYLMMRAAFDLGYRRYEWKCDALNAASQAAARRLGFLYEGVFRQATHYKGRNRDTAWLAITDQDWPECRTALERWLAAENFDGQGNQRKPLGAFRPDAVGKGRPV